MEDLVDLLLQEGPVLGSLPKRPKNNFTAAGRAFLRSREDLRQAGRGLPRARDSSVLDPFADVSQVRVNEGLFPRAKKAPIMTLIIVSNTFCKHSIIENTNLYFAPADWLLRKL